MDKTTIRVGGVPEHFNLPWHLAIENGDFEKEGLEIIWTDFYGGTGAMTKALREKETDVAVVLTEGIVAAIIKGDPAKIIGQYVRSSLVWGIHTAAQSKFQDASELKGQRYAISRFGSGSHIMTFVDAINRGWNPAEQQFVKVGNLDGARKAMVAGEADALLWEKFTTKPYVDSGELRRIGISITPWPCFVMAVNEDFLKEKREAIQKMLLVIYKCCRQFMEMPDAIEMVAERYGLQKEDAEEWFKQTKWSTNTLMSKAVLNNVVDTLLDVKVIEEKKKPKHLCDKDIVKFEKRIYNFRDQSEISTFFDKEVYACLEKLQVHSPARWGILTPQHMLEHLMSYLFLSTGEQVMEKVIKDKDKQAEAKSIILNDKLLPKRVRIPGMEPKQLMPLKFADIEQSKNMLKDVLIYTLNHLEQHPEQVIAHPFGGEMSVNEWRIFHYKHFVHHFRQFDLL